MSDVPGSSPKAYPAAVTVEGALEERNRLTTLFRLILALPHLFLVGGPVLFGITGGMAMNEGADTAASGFGGGLIGILVVVAAVIHWVVLVVAARSSDPLWRLTAFFLRWRVRAIAYLMLLRDEYPPFGDAPYPVRLTVGVPEDPRNRLTVFARLLLVVPHLIVLWFLNLAWFITTVVGWFAILATGRFPAPLYDFGAGVLRWNTRVEVYTLLLRDEYPPFRLEA
jgi:hypothetical protein